MKTKNGARERGKKHKRNEANKQICGDFNVATHKINGNH